MVHDALAAGGAFTPAQDVVLDEKLYTMIDLEGRRYAGFFAQLDAAGAGSVPKAAAVGFFARSALTDAQVTELYERIKGVGLLADPDRVNATEFTMAMHLIVCMTKRNLVKIPPKFPTYLFPTLDLSPTPVAAAGRQSVDRDDDLWSGASVTFPSAPPTPMSTGGGGAAFANMDMHGSNHSSFSYDTPKLRMEDLSTSSSSLSAAAAKLQDARSLVELVQTEIYTRKTEAVALARLDKSHARTLQSLHSCLDMMAGEVDKLGFPVPTTSRTLDALDDLRNLFDKHVHSVKQEIQTMEISAQMRSVASEVTASSGSGHDNRLKEIDNLTLELVRLQQEASQLSTRRDDLSEQVETAKAKAVEPAAPAAGAYDSLPLSDVGSTKALSSKSSSSSTSAHVLSATTPSSVTVNEDTASTTFEFAAVPSPSPVSDDWGTFSTTSSQPDAVASAAKTDPFDFTAPAASPAAVETTTGPGSILSSTSSQPEPSQLESANGTKSDPFELSPSASQSETLFSPMTQTDVAKAETAEADPFAFDAPSPSPLPAAVEAESMSSFGSFSQPDVVQSESAATSATVDPFGFASPSASPSTSSFTASTLPDMAQSTTAKDDPFGFASPSASPSTSSFTAPALPEVVQSDSFKADSFEFASPSASPSTSSFTAPAQPETTQPTTAKADSFEFASPSASPSTSSFTAFSQAEVAPSDSFKADAFDFGAPTTSAPAATDPTPASTTAANDDFGWGAFQ